MNKRMRYVFLLLVLVTAVLLIKNAAERRRFQEGVKALFSQVQEETITDAYVYTRDADKGIIQYEIRDNGLLQTCLLILHPDEPFILHKEKKDTWFRSLASIYVNTPEGVQIVLECLDGRRFLVRAHESYCFAGQQEYTLFLPQLYEEVIVPAIETGGGVV